MKSGYNLFNFADVSPQCGDPGSVYFAYSSTSGGPYTVGSRVTYTCNPGLIGGGTITCQPNGQWSQRPTCSRSMIPNSDTNIYFVFLLSLVFFVN